MTTTEVENLAVEYPPEKINAYVAPLDKVVILEPRDRAQGEYVGKVGKVVRSNTTRGADGGYITVEVEETGIQLYVTEWIHNWVVAQKPEAKDQPKVGAEVTILRCLCCSEAMGAKGVVSIVNGNIMAVDVSVDGVVQQHLTDFTDLQVLDDDPLDYVEMAPDVKVGEVVLVLRCESDSKWNFTFGTVKEKRAFASEHRDYLIVTVANHVDVWVSSWVRKSDAPPTMQPVERGQTTMALRVFGSTSPERIGSVGVLHDTVANRGVRLLADDGTYIRTSQWMAVPGESSAEHHSPVPRNTRVRIVGVKSADRKALVGAIGVTTSDVSGERESCMVEVKGERVLVNAWAPVGPDGSPINPRFVSMMTDEQVEALIEELFTVADRLADKEQWCEEYDRVMHERIGRPRDSIRLTARYLVEVVLTPKEGIDPRFEEEFVFAEYSRKVRFMVQGNGGGPNLNLIQGIIKEAGMADGYEFTINNQWRQ